MAAARYSQDVLQSPTDVELEEIIKLDEAIQSLPPEPREIIYKDFGEVLNLDEAIQSLPPELRKIIYKKFVGKKLRERAALGWKKVHEAILKKPFSVPHRSCLRCRYGSFVSSSLLCWYCERDAMNRHYNESWRGRLNKLASRIFERCIFGSGEALTFLNNRGYSSLILTVLALRQHDMRQCR